MSRAIVVAIAAASMAIAPLAAAQPGLGPPGATADRLSAATAAAAQGDWPTVVTLVTPIADDGGAARGDRAEAHRLLGLAALDRGDAATADARFFAYLKLELDGRLDPALYPPEQVAFFEDVRGRHAAELRALRPKPRRSLALNLLPPAGQFQNGHRAKGWTLAVVGGTALVANVSTYALLRSWCSDDGTCRHASTARILRDVNLGTGIATIGLYVYGVWDGLRHFKRTPTTTITPLAFSQGSGLGIAGVF